MFKSIFSKYFVALSAILVSSFVLLGALLLVLTNRYWKADKQALLCENARNVAQFAAENATCVGPAQYRLDAGLMPFLDLLMQAIDARALVTDNDGLVVLCSEGTDCSHIGMSVPSGQMAEISRSQEWFGTGKLGGIYDEMRYVAAVPMDRDGTRLGFVLVTTSTSLSTAVTLNNLRTFLLSSLAVWALFFIVLYALTYRLVKPLRRMTEAARHFSSGDFAARVQVSGRDEIAELAQALNAMAGSLASAEGMRRSFIANVSHELRTPMTTISGFVDGVLDGTIPPEKHQQYLQVVSRETKRLSRLVYSMLALSRIDNGEMKLARTAVDLTEVAGNVLLSFEQHIDKKGLTIDGDEQAVAVSADRDLLGQVMYNLIENAVKFSDEGGTLTLSTRAEGGRGYFTLRNTGHGIAPEELPHIFERFYKSDASRSLDKTGMGLGLFLVKQIVTLHGGEITVRSLQGSYCEFELWLPLAADPRDGKL